MLSLMMCFIKYSNIDKGKYQGKFKEMIFYETYMKAVDMWELLSYTI